MSLPGTLDKAWCRFDSENNWKDRVLKLEKDETSYGEAYHAWVWSDQYNKAVFICYAFYNKRTHNWRGYSLFARVDAPRDIKLKFLNWTKNQMKLRGKNLKINKSINNLVNNGVKK